MRARSPAFFEELRPDEEEGPGRRHRRVPSRRMGARVPDERATGDPLAFLSVIIREFGIKL